MRTERKGFLGAYLVGMITGVVAAPCVGPVLVVLLTWVAQTGNMLIGFLLLFTYAVGIGILFIVIGTFAGAVTTLPGAGKWMETIKHIFGVVLFVGAIFILKPLLPSGIYLLIWGTLLVVVGVFMDALEVLSKDNKKGSRWIKAVGVLLLIAGIVTFIKGYNLTFGLTEKTSNTLQAEQISESIGWIVNDVDIAFERALLEDKGVIMDFYADWCAACVELDEKTWNTAELSARKNSWIFLKIDLTRSTPELKEIQTNYNIRGMPTVIFFTSKGEEKARFSGFKDASGVVGIMDSLLHKGY